MERKFKEGDRVKVVNYAPTVGTWDPDDPAQNPNGHVGTVRMAQLDLYQQVLRATFDIYEVEIEGLPDTTGNKHWPLVGSELEAVDA